MPQLAGAVQAIEVGLLPAIQLDGHPHAPMSLSERMARYRVPGLSLALIEESEIVWAKSYGVLEAGRSVPVSTESRFQAASISKTVTAMAALRLAETGQLALDADVNTMLKAWQVPENEHTRVHKVTLRGLLSHTAGVTVRGFRGYAAGEPRPTVRQILDGLPPANSEPVRVAQVPGTGYCYAGGGYTVVQQLLEEITGTPFAELLQNLVLDPLGLVHSSFEQPLSGLATTTAAVAHRGNGAPVLGRWHIYPEQAAAGLWTTPPDLARLALDLLAAYEGAPSTLLSTAMARQMLTPASDSGYGLGIALVGNGDQTRFEHTGSNEGYRCMMTAQLATGRGVIWMTNGDNGEALGLEVLRGLARHWGWSGFEPRTETAVPVAPTFYDRIAGDYRLVTFPDYAIRLSRDNDRLTLQELPGGLSYRLYPVAPTAFVALEFPERLTVLLDDHGDVASLMFDDHLQLLPDDRAPCDPA